AHIVALDLAVGAHGGGLHLIGLMRIDELFEKRFVGLRTREGEAADGVRPQIRAGLFIRRRDGGARERRGPRGARWQSRNLDEAQRRSSGRDLWAAKDMQQQRLARPQAGRYCRLATHTEREAFQAGRTPPFSAVMFRARHFFDNRLNLAWLAPRADSRGRQPNEVLVSGRIL